MQISLKVARIAADAIPELLEDIKHFFINLFQYSAEYVSLKLVHIRYGM